MDRDVVVVNGLHVHKNELNLHFSRPMTNLEKKLDEGQLRKKINHQYTKNRKDGTVVYVG